MPGPEQYLYRLCNPDKHSAVKIVSQALKTGKLVKPKSCEDCKNDDSNLEAHHTDYAKPLDVVWLCSRCHKEADKKRRLQEQSEGFSTRIELRVPWDLMHSIDTARGLVSRSAWIRQAMEEKIAIFINEQPMREERLLSAAEALGQKGGKSKSEIKAAAARENGKKGGRPRKESKSESEKQK